MEIIQKIKINENFYILNEAINPNLYFTMALVIGKERAALIDTGYGTTGDLDKIIRTITDKPVICLITHCDPDHAGSAALFEEIYMNKLDEPLMRGSLMAQVRLMIVKKAADNKQIYGYAKEHIVKKTRFQYKNIEEGHIFDLGDCEIEAISLPGHTKGSMCFFNRNENYVITGDSVANANSPVLFFDKCLPLVAYKENLQRFLKIIGEDAVIYTGHDILPLQKQIVSEILVLCDEILTGNTADDSPYMPPFLETDESNKRSITGIVHNMIVSKAAKMQLGDSCPREHKKEGFIASVKYNANNIR